VVNKIQYILKVDLFFFHHRKALTIFKTFVSDSGDTAPAEIANDKSSLQCILLVRVQYISRETGKLNNLVGALRVLFPGSKVRFYPARYA